MLDGQRADRCKEVQFPFVGAEVVSESRQKQHAGGAFDPFGCAPASAQLRRGKQGQTLAPAFARLRRAGRAGSALPRCYFGVGEAASFWKRGSLPSGSNIGSSRITAGVIATPYGVCSSR